MQKNRITQLFNIEYPVIQAGMVWCSGWELASAVSNAGGLGIIGSGSMYPQVLKEHVVKCKQATDKPFAVNLPLLYPNIEEHIQTIIEEKVPIVFTSAGNPKIWTEKLKSYGIKVVHVVSSSKFALKAQNAGCDAVVAEGFEAGGHNGREETTTLCLIPEVVNKVTIPVIAAGGIASGKAMLACMALGAEAVQIGSLFVTAEESSAHINYKQKLLTLEEGSTVLTLKDVTPVRMIKNKFYDVVQDAYQKHLSPEQIKEKLGKGNAKKGMFEGDIEAGELEIGQIASMFTNIRSAKDIFTSILQEYHQAKEEVLNAMKYKF